MTDTFVTPIELNKQTGDITCGGCTIFAGYRSSCDCVEDIGTLGVRIGDKSRSVECPEGKIIRVFFHGDRWYVATNRKLDASTSRFMSKRETYGDAFARVLKTRYNLSVEKDFDKTKKYVLLLKPSEHERIVCDIDEDIVFICCDGDVDSRELEMLPRRRETSEFPHYTVAQGLYFIDENIRVFSKEYARRREIRGKTPSLRFRYLELRTSPDDLIVFFDMYPDMVHVAEVIEEQIYSIAKHLHALYMRVFVKNDMTMICTKTEKTVLNAVHKMYTTTKQRTVPSRINDLLAQIQPTRLNRLLREAFVSKPDHAVTKIST